MEFAIAAPMALSAIAIGVSIYGVWRTHLKPFSPVWMLSGPRLRFFDFKQEVTVGQQHFAFGVLHPIVDMTVSILNNGNLPGRITDLRLSFRSPDLSFALFPSCLADAIKMRDMGVHDCPFTLIEEVQKAAWSGLFAPKGTVVTEHIIFQTNAHGLREIPRGTFTVSLEYAEYGSNKWEVAESRTVEFDEVCRGLLGKGDPCLFQHVGTNRVWPEEWKDTKNVVVGDEEVEKLLGRPLNS